MFVNSRQSAAGQGGGSAPRPAPQSGGRDAALRGSPSAAGEILPRPLPKSPHSPGFLGTYGRGLGVSAGLGCAFPAAVGVLAFKHLHTDQLQRAVCNSLPPVISWLGLKVPAELFGNVRLLCYHISDFFFPPLSLTVAYNCLWLFLWKKKVSMRKVVVDF